MTRKQIKKRITILQKRLGELNSQLNNVTQKHQKLTESKKKIIKELKESCDKLGRTWSKDCPAFVEERGRTHCIIQDWLDDDSAKFCINCSVARKDAFIRGLFCRLKPTSLDEDRKNE